MSVACGRAIELVYGPVNIVGRVRPLLAGCRLANLCVARQCLTDGFETDRTRIHMRLACQFVRVPFAMH